MGFTRMGDGKSGPVTDLDEVSAGVGLVECEGVEVGGNVVGGAAIKEPGGAVIRVGEGLMCSWLPWWWLARRHWGRSQRRGSACRNKMKLGTAFCAVPLGSTGLTAPEVRAGLSSLWVGGSRAGLWSGHGGSPRHAGTGGSGVSSDGQWGSKRRGSEEESCFLVQELLMELWQGDRHVLSVNGINHGAIFVSQSSQNDISEVLVVQRLPKQNKGISMGADGVEEVRTVALPLVHRQSCSLSCLIWPRDGWAKVLARCCQSSRDEVVLATRGCRGGERLPRSAEKSSLSCWSQESCSGLGTTVPLMVIIVAGRGCWILTKEHGQSVEV